MESRKHKVVVIGGGVGGLAAASRLSKDSLYETTLISKKRSFDHHTSLHRSKRGTSRRHITLPLQSIFTKRAELDLVRAEISKVDSRAQVVCSKEGLEYEYDSLIVALEGEAKVPEGIPEDETYNAYSASEMNSLRRRLLREYAEGIIGPRYCVVGSGETGVEIAFELRQLIRSLTKKYAVEQQPSIVLIEHDERVLPVSPPKISRRVDKKLKRAGIDIATGEQAVAYKNGSLAFASGDTFESDAIVLASGQRANHFFAENEKVFLLDDNKRVRVNVLQEAEGYNNIYIIGNSKASDTSYGTEGKLYDADYIVKLLNCKRYGKEIDRYEPPEHELHMQLGHGWAVYQSGVRVYSGVIGWVRKRWLDRSHFSTLLPTRLWLKIWFFGSQHDEIQ